MVPESQYRKKEESKQANTKTPPVHFSCRRTVIKVTQKIRKAVGQDILYRKKKV